MNILWQGLVPTDSLDIVKERIEKMAKRAERIGFPVPTLDIGTAEIVDNISWSSIAIMGDSLRLGDYRLIGTVASLEDGTPFITYAPGAPRLKDGVITNVNQCDHCNTIRQRKDTFVVQAAGLPVQVGSSCVKDFLGHDPSIITAYLGMVESLNLSDEVEGWAMSATRFYPVHDIVEAAARVVVQTGYVNKQKALDEDTTSTVEFVRNILTAGPKQQKDLLEDFPFTDEVDILVDNTFAAVEELEPRNEWESDIARLFTQRGVQYRHVGILASSVILAMRKREAKAVSKGESEFMWQKDERVTFDAVVTLKRGFDGAFGYSYIIRMTPVGTTNDVLHFGSAGVQTDPLEEGKTYTVTATVKNHELDKRTERPTTVITRAKYVAKENA
jgi:hypothetical protein